MTTNQLSTEEIVSILLAKGDEFKQSILEDQRIPISQEQIDALLSPQLFDPTDNIYKTKHQHLLWSIAKRKDAQFTQEQIDIFLNQPFMPVHAAVGLNHSIPVSREVYDKMLCSPSIDVIEAFLSRNEFTPTREQISRTLNNTFLNPRTFANFISKEDVLFNDEQIEFIITGIRLQYSPEIAQSLMRRSDYTPTPTQFDQLLHHQHYLVVAEALKTYEENLLTLEQIDYLKNHNSIEVLEAFITYPQPGVFIDEATLKHFSNQNLPRLSSAVAQYISTRDSNALKKSISKDISIAPNTKTKTL